MDTLTTITNHPEILDNPFITAILGIIVFFIAVWVSMQISEGRKNIYKDPF